MKTYHLTTFSIILVLTACQSNFTKIDIEKSKKEIVETELAFAKIAKEEGLSNAFTSYAANDGVLNRNNKIISGKPAIKKYLESSSHTNISLEWTPDFVDVSASGDLGYTYGKFTYSAQDTSGQIIKSEGIFHTVWKRQADGTWKFVYD
ncbi:MAG: nuclear transport factor 2 family protein [Bacteroidetes bacterium]|jgi:ketosteroid isomerase-like protein|nr:nuclear transport factor 2 family protein [Bacteroidota bacterium]MDF1867062.1 nuclear transport factor 2 family protein [Saprospiraceae bacterium]